MNTNFKKVSKEELHFDVFQDIGEDWMLITAGTEEKHNTMTASWGTLGVIWNKPVAIIFVRPERYTYEFLEKEERFTLSFFEKHHKEDLQFFGTKSGRDIDKIKERDFSPIVLNNNIVAFDEAEKILICKKLYSQSMSTSFFNDSEMENLFANENHKIFIGEIEEIYIKNL